MVDVGRILIVGGGIAGLALATALHQHGCTAELIERSPSWLSGPLSPCGRTASASCARSAWC